MSYRIEEIDFFVRETGPARFASALGKAAQGNQQRVRVTSPICHTRMILNDSSGERTFGCSADRLSVRWLDKRPERTQKLKRTELGTLIKFAGESYKSSGEISSVFDTWLTHHNRVMSAGRRANQEDLTSSFASALLERAMLDGVCRLEKKPFYEMLKNDAFNVDVSKIHPNLSGQKLARWITDSPVTSINIRHTVGLYDPLTSDDQPLGDRLEDGLPETLTEYIEKQGIRFFKIKISGDVKSDLRRLANIWDLLPSDRHPVVTLDANEAFDDVEVFGSFLRRLESEQLGMFQHIAYVEQPLRRDIALSSSVAKGLGELSKRKTIIIDESDSSLTSFQRALSLGYVGTSHKNCKGVFKSLAHKVLVGWLAEQGIRAILSAEDLQNLPVVPLQQDFAMVGILGLDHCERNGHHYNKGLSMLSDRDKDLATKRHSDLYRRHGDEWYLGIVDGAVQCASLHRDAGFGVVDEPDWDSMVPLEDWLG